LDTLVLLYAKVQQQVCIGGDVGRLFDTYVGTKQGSELSPLLFGMFIDMLHELIQMQVPGAGPMLEQLRVPDISYADDVSLIAYDDPAQAQHLLDCLSIFCAIFKMEVNQHELKTCAVVFRCQHTRIPADVVLTYRGIVVPFKEQHLCLGVILHATKNLHVAAEALAASGSRAKHAVLGRCRQQCITQFDFKCRIFDILVEPIMSYGCQVWGPDVFVSKVASDKAYTAWSDAENVHVSYLRTMAGVGKCCIEVLMKDFNRVPIMHHWVLLAARWFMTLTCMSADRLARCAFVADIDLMLNGCRNCWTYKLLHTMSLLGLLARTEWDRRANSVVDRQCILQLQLVEKSIEIAMRGKMVARWATIIREVDPRSAPSTGLEMCTHAAWVQKFEGDSCALPKHMKLCVSFVVLQCLARLRLGWHQLRVRTERLKHGRARLPRSERLCRLCSTEGASFHAQRVGASCVEDVQHFMLECPAYRHLRAKYPCVFGNAVGESAQLRLLSIFDCDHQDQLAHVVYIVTVFRNHCLSLPHGNHIVVNDVQQIVEEDDEVIRIQ
jgi:Reverse transcriptase (RNA-dependent DNA polymerase)